MIYMNGIGLHEPNDKDTIPTFFKEYTKIISVYKITKKIDK